MSEQTWNGTQLQLRLSGPRCEGLTVVLPLKAEGKLLGVVSANGDPLVWKTARCHGRPVAQAVLPAAATDVQVVADYTS